MLRTRRLVYAAATLLLQLIVITRSETVGKLAGLVPWDDCAFLERGLRNMERVLGADSLWALTRRLAAIEFHALGDLSTLAGLLLFQQAAWGAYVLNCLVVLIGLVVVDRFFHRQPSWARMGLCAFFLLVPFVVGTFDSLKSDLAGGVFLTAALLLLFDTERGLYAASGSVATAIASGLLLGLTAMAQATAFYIAPVLVMVVVLSLGYAVSANRVVELRRPSAWRLRVHVANREAVRSCLRRGILSIAVMLTMVGALWGIAFQHLTRYVAMVLAGPPWQGNLSLAAQMMFYSPFGSHSARFWGEWWWFGACFVPAALVLTIKERQRRTRLLGCMMVVCLLFALPVLVAPIYNPAFAVYVYAAVLALMLFGMRIVFEKLSRPALAAVVVAMLVAGACQEQPLYRQPGGRDAARLYRRAFERFAAEIHRASGERAARGRPRVLMSFVHRQLPQPELRMIYWRRYGAWPNVLRQSRTPQGVGTRELPTESVQWVITIDNSDSKGLAQRFASSRSAARMHSQMLADQRFRLVATAPLPDASVHLFRKLTGEAHDD